MTTDIKTQIENINRCIEWIRDNRPEEFASRYIELVEERRKLKKLAAAEIYKPGIAAYGISQVGKSHIISGLLQHEVKNDDGKTVIKQFEITANGKSYDFVKEINPPGNGTEATGVVTRFSTFNESKVPYDNQYPALMKSLSVTDITLVVCDGYFNDIKDYTFYSDSELNEKAEANYQHYMNMAPQPTCPVSADDILEMKYYFQKYINNAQTISRSDYFNKLALVIDRVPFEDYAAVFSILWHDEPIFTALFKRLLGVLQKLDFSEYAYLPIEALDHKQVKADTPMSVECLNNLALPQDPHTCNVFLRCPDNSFKCLPDMNKSEIAAICREVMFKVEKDVADSTHHYAFESISADSKSQLSEGDIKTGIMWKADLLDFPGARSRKQLSSKGHNEEEKDRLNQATVIEVLLRGKVAYLFNKYSDDKIINILLFCHHDEQHNVSSLPSTLEEWVRHYVGKSPEARKKTVEMTGNISPFFYIATKFNIDMQETRDENLNAINTRWKSRFSTVLERDCFGASNVDWVRNFTEKGKNFSNSFLLRDFKYSGPEAKESHLFEGFRESGKETKQLISDNHAKLLRDSFINSDDVKRYFENPALSWDVAATMNNDGTVYIIEKLKKAAEHISKTRDDQFKNDVRKCLNSVLDKMRSYYQSDDDAEILAENVRKANRIYRELVFTCQSDPEFFGHLIESLQLTEPQCYSEVHSMIPSLPAIVGNDDTIQDYELIRKACDDFQGCSNVEQKWQRLTRAYGFWDKDEATEYLRQHNIDPDTLFGGSEVEEIDRRNSAILAHHLIHLWESRLKDPTFHDKYTGNKKVNSTEFGYLVDAMLNAAKNIQLKKRIETEISPYVDILNIAGINEDLVADAISTTICDFVMDFGYRYLDNDKKAQVNRIVGEQHIGIFQRTANFQAAGMPRKESYTEDEMTALFNSILNSARRFTPAYEENFDAWVKYMYLSHIVNLNIPDFDREANTLLKEILESLKSGL